MPKLPYYIAKLLNTRRQSNCLKIKQSFLGFTLIELLIVITLFGLSASLITASYLTFERNNRIRNAALNLKNDLRLAQSNALSGNKGVIGTAGNCSDAEPLVGWYVKVIVGTSDYLTSGVCKIETLPHKYIPIDAELDEIVPVNNKAFPNQVTVKSFQIDNGLEHVNSGDEVSILFRPLTNKAAFYDVLSGNLSDENFIGTTGSTGILTITFIGSQDNTYKVRVNSASGEVNEEK